MKKMKILAVALLFVLPLALSTTSCQKKRCLCVTTRAEHQNARGIEDLGEHKNCAELDKEWVVDDSTRHIIEKKCTPFQEE